jgi:hypothetical protein
VTSGNTELIGAIIRWAPPQYGAHVQRFLLFVLAQLLDRLAHGTSFVSQLSHVNKMVTQKTMECARMMTSADL